MKPCSRSIVPSSRPSVSSTRAPRRSGECTSQAPRLLLDEAAGGFEVGQLVVDDRERLAGRDRAGPEAVS